MVPDRPRRDDDADQLVAIARHSAYIFLTIV